MCITLSDRITLSDGINSKVKYIRFSRRVQFQTIFPHRASISMNIYQAICPAADQSHDSAMSRGLHLEAGSEAQLYHC